jgi:hypothetical protein
MASKGVAEILLGKNGIIKQRLLQLPGDWRWQRSEMSGPISHVSFPYPYIGGQWLECIADDFAQVHERSEREWHLVLEEWREHQRQHQQKRITLNGPLLAQFLNQLKDDETLEEQRQRDHEEHAQRAALLLQTTAERKSRTTLPPIEVDLTRIQPFEEYR